MPHGELLLRFVDACMGDDQAELDTVREEVVAELGNDGLVDSSAIVGTFNQMVRIADATGIPLDSPLDMATVSFREALGLDHFGSASNTAQAGPLKKSLLRAVETITAPIRPTLFKAFLKIRGG